MPLRYLALGDSYTIGEGVEPADRWPLQLARALHGEGIDLQDPRIIATTGWTTDELSGAIDAAGPLGGFDLVSLLIGVNNQYRGRGVDEYRRQFEALLRRAVGFADGRPGRVLVLSIPDWGRTAFAAASGRDRARIGEEIDLFNRSAAETCTAHGVAFVDVTTIGRERDNEPGILVDDGLHPSAAMYAEWTRLALPYARQALCQPA